MTDSERLLQRQAVWQRKRACLSWPAKIRQAERLRASVEALRRQRLSSSPTPQAREKTAPSEGP